MDLARAANVCVRFNELAESVFSTDKYKKFDFTKCNYTEVKTTLEKFGSLSQSIDINGYSLFSNSRGAVDGDEALSMIDKFCTTIYCLESNIDKTFPLWNCVRYTYIYIYCYRYQKSTKLAGIGTRYDCTIWGNSNIREMYSLFVRFNFSESAEAKFEFLISYTTECFSSKKRYTYRAYAA